MAPFDVSVIGELNLDLILYGLPQSLVLEREHLATDLSITLGSSSAIFAHNLSHLGNRVGFSACIGDDPFGEICVQRLSAGGVDVSHIKKLRGKTTGLTVILPQRKDRFILTYPGAMYEMSERELDQAFVFNARHLHLSSYFLQKGIRPQLIHIFRKAKEAGLTTSLDTNDDPEDRWSGDIQLLLRYVDILLPNERELCKLAQVSNFDQAVESLSQKVRILVVKRGSQGAIARVGKEKFAAYPPVVDVVDPVGAGDTFDAGFVHQFIRGAKIEDCLKFANCAGALSITRAGGTEAFRDAAHREAFFRKHAAGSSPSGGPVSRPTS
ncbi:MAG TPA: carbohydrate kinase family protein [Candidatus Acidoferrum sp.]|nr:carbohydrate kinase family protein [Candidatus Acidoferrum sp.]